jgi:hypothetical protein
MALAIEVRLSRDAFSKGIEKKGEFLYRKEAYACRCGGRTKEHLDLELEEREYKRSEQAAYVSEWGSRNDITKIRKC